MVSSGGGCYSGNGCGNGRESHCHPPLSILPSPSSSSRPPHHFLLYASSQVQQRMKKFKPGTDAAFFEDIDLQNGPLRWKWGQKLESIRASGSEQAFFNMLTIGRPLGPELPFRSALDMRARHKELALQVRTSSILFKYTDTCLLGSTRSYQSHFCVSVANQCMYSYTYKPKSSCQDLTP